MNTRLVGTPPAPTPVAGSSEVRNGLANAKGSAASSSILSASSSHCFSRRRRAIRLFDSRMNSTAANSCTFARRRMMR